MGIDTVSGLTGFNAAQYESLQETAKSRNVDSAVVDAALLNAVKNGKMDFSAAVQQVQMDLPPLEPPKSTAKPSLNEWVSMPSPGALFASVMVMDAAEQRAQNKEMIRSQGEEMASLMEEQADKIVSGAIQKFACAVAGAVISMAAGAASVGIAAGGLKTDSVGKMHVTDKGAVKSNNAAATKLEQQYQGGTQNPLTQQQATAVNALRNAGVGKMDSMTVNTVAQGVNTMISGLSSIVSSAGDLGQSIEQAGVKRLEAKQEELRTYQELNKQHNEALRDLIAKSLDFMNSMQANMNQTRTKILG